ncbi:MAG: HEPN domain-containing protein [Anaerolineae bacterium]
MLNDERHRWELLEEIGDLLLSLRSDVVSIVAFGSFVRDGDYDDIDLLVVLTDLSKPPLERKDEILEIKDRIKHLPPADVLLVSVEECVDNFEAHVPLFLDIAFDGRIIHDNDFVARLMRETREYVKSQGIVRTESGGWRFPVRFRQSTPLSQLKDEEWASIWLGEAEQDLLAARRLLEAGIYDKCVTHCQQVVEKVVKAILICFGRSERSHYVGRALEREIKRQKLGQWTKELKVIARDAENLEPDVSLSRYPKIFGDRIWVPHREYDTTRAKSALQKAQFALDRGKEFVAWWFSGSEGGR